MHARASTHTDTHAHRRKSVLRSYAHHLNDLKLSTSSELSKSEMFPKYKICFLIKRVTFFFFIQPSPELIAPLFISPLCMLSSFPNCTLPSYRVIKRSPPSPLAPYFLHLSRAILKCQNMTVIISGPPDLCKTQE